MNFDKQLDVFSRNLSEIRRNGRYSYQAFSEKLRVGKSTVQAIESGDYNITLSRSSQSLIPWKSIRHSC